MTLRERAIDECLESPEAFDRLLRARLLNQITSEQYDAELERLVSTQMDLISERVSGSGDAGDARRKQEQEDFWLGIGA